MHSYPSTVPCVHSSLQSECGMALLLLSTYAMLQTSSRCPALRCMKLGIAVEQHVMKITPENPLDQVHVLLFQKQ